MSIFKTIFEKYGGKTWLESQEEKVMVFFITMPKISDKKNIDVAISYS